MPLSMSRTGLGRDARGTMLALSALACLAACEGPPAGVRPDTALLELAAPALAAGRVSAEDVTRAALERIAALDDAGPRLNAVLELNPDALAIARELDRRFATDGAVGPLHGVPVVLKANIDTGDRMATSAGAAVLAGHYAGRDAPLVARLREAGAVIVAKGNLSEWANFRSLASSSGFSALGGQTANPYVLDRNPCGSSSGSAVAVAARLVPLAVGTETDGSIVCPAGANGVVGIKPTVGLVEQAGIIPIASSQDTAGPMARTVEGAALLLAAMQSPAFGAPETYGVRGERLDGFRVGAIRDYAGAGRFPAVEAAYDEWLRWLEQAGAEVVDPVEVGLPPEAGQAELEVLLYEFKAGLNAYLAAAGIEPASLAELIAYYDAESGSGPSLPDFGHDLFVMAEARGDLTEPAYLAALAASHEAVRGRLESLFAGQDLDALVAPANGPAWKTDWVAGDSFSISSSRFAAIAGYPSVVVPGGLIGELPVGAAFIGEPLSEATLIGIAAVFEAKRGPMPAPRFIPSLETP